jgi:hypothetical protein
LKVILLACILFFLFSFLLGCYVFGSVRSAHIYIYYDIIKIDISNYYNMIKYALKTIFTVMRNMSTINKNKI